MKPIKIALLLVLLYMSISLKAAEFCVTTAFELYNALSAADSNAAHDIIKIAEGNYATNGSAFSYRETQGWDLEISGGWTESQGNPCALQLGNNPTGTTLNGNHNNGILEISLFGQANLRVVGITFNDGYKGFPFRGGGLEVFKFNNLVLGTIIIENNVFINNQAEFESALMVSGAEEIIIRNNLFVGNNAHNSWTISAVQNNGYGIYFTNNTLIYNSASATNDSGAFISVSGTSQALVANNVLWGNESTDLYLSGNGDVYLKNNDLGQMDSNITPLESSGNFSLPPRFESGFLSLPPSVISPLVNAGIKPCSFCPIPIPFDETWSLGSIDLAGNIRNQKGKVDIGAFESSHDPDLIFWGIFE